MSARRDLTGQKFGMLTALQFVESGGGKTKWKFLCKCGQITVKSKSDVLSGRSTSCGCFRKSNAVRLATTHGESKTTSEYKAWCFMHRRCKNPSDTSFRLYGGRGITVCERWDSYECFLKDMGRKPSDKHSLDRIDSNGNYVPENCRWSDRITQNNNKRNNLMLSYQGKTQTAAQWAREKGISPRTLRSRITERGWPVEEALSRPLTWEGRNLK